MSSEISFTPSVSALSALVRVPAGQKSAPKRNLSRKPSKAEEKQETDRKLNSLFAKLTSRVTDDADVIVRFSQMLNFLADLQKSKGIREFMCPTCDEKIGEVKGFALVNVTVPDDKTPTLDELVEIVSQCIQQGVYNEVVYNSCMLQWKSFASRIFRSVNYPWPDSKCKCEENTNMNIFPYSLMPSCVQQHCKFIQDVSDEYTRNNTHLWNCK